ncbi:YciI family protein [Burkholderia stabilis]|uniref:YciI family protein n=1 Tax=Burkholderia stabilis TaxID=95485 RepID=UPI00399A6A06
MLFIVRFTDKPESLPLRQELLPSHLQWLQQHQTAILVAGSLRTEPSTAPVGACWVVEAQSKSEVVALFQADPFWVGGLRAGYEILHWSKAFPERQVPV